MSWTATAEYSDGELNVTYCSPPEEQMVDEVAEAFDIVRKVARLLVEEKMPFKNADVRFGGHVSAGADDSSSSNVYLQITGVRSKSELPIEDADDDEAETTTDDDREATEAAAEKAKELNVDLDSVTGTGEGGRILVEDVVKAAEDTK